MAQIRLPRNTARSEKCHRCDPVGLAPRFKFPFDVVPPDDNLERGNTMKREPYWLPSNASDAQRIALWKQLGKDARAGDKFVGMKY